MLTMEEMKERKKELGYTNKEISQLSGVPFGTVQKIFSGETEKPRFQTMMMLDDLLSGPRRAPGTEPYPFNSLQDSLQEATRVHDPALAYEAVREESLPINKKQGEFTVDDYDALPQERRVELIDGVIYDMGAPTTTHQALIGAIHHMFYGFLLEHPERDCEILLSPVDVQLDEDEQTMVQPDLVGLCHRGEEDKRTADQRRIYGAPDFVLEVLSSGTSSRDCILKLSKYRNAGCGEYWIVDPQNERVTVYRFKDSDCRDIPVQYTFKEKVPVAMSGDELFIDFAEIRRQLRRHFD